MEAKFGKSWRALLRTDDAAGEHAEPPELELAHPVTWNMWQAYVSIKKSEGILLDKGGSATAHGYRTAMESKFGKHWRASISHDHRQAMPRDTHGSEDEGGAPASSSSVSLAAQKRIVPREICHEYIAVSKAVNSNARLQTSLKSLANHLAEIEKLEHGKQVSQRLRGKQKLLDSRQDSPVMEACRQAQSCLQGALEESDQVGSASMILKKRLGTQRSKDFFLGKNSKKTRKRSSSAKLKDSGHAHSHNLSGWVAACKRARVALDLPVNHPIKKETPEHKKAWEYYKSA